MFARFVCVFACVVLAQCLPTRHPSEEFVVKITNAELLKELASLDKEYAEIDSKKAIDYEVNYTTDETPDDVDVAEDAKIEKVEESLRVKRNVNERTDIETIVTVKNNEIGNEKKYYFKTINRDVSGEKYKCKIGLTSGDVIFYYRCLLVSNGITGEGLQETGQGDFFDIA